MGAPGAVRILHGRDLARATPEDRARQQLELELEYKTRFSNPYVAAERGFVDDVIAATDTRRELASALAKLVSKREHHPTRRHSNTPL